VPRLTRHRDPAVPRQKRRVPEAAAPNSLFRCGHPVVPCRNNFGPIAPALARKGWWNARCPSRPGVGATRGSSRSLRWYIVDKSLFPAHHDLENRHWWFRGRRHALVELGVRLLKPGVTVVDVGCGTGADIAAFPASFERHGIDPSNRAIGFARQSHSGVSFQVGTAPEVGRDVIGAASLVLLCDVLEHIEDDVAFLGALLSAMKPGAFLLLTVPACPWLWSPHDEVYGHHRRYTGATLTEVWREAPAQPRLLAPFNRRLYPAVRLARAISARRGRGWGSAASDLILPPPVLNWALEKVFAGEAAALVAALENGSGVRGTGVSLLAVLERAGEAARA
jgi:SAM-dependent methyltransferase